MTDCDRSSIQYRRSGFTNLVAPESDCSWIDEPASVMVGMVRDFHTRSYSLHSRYMGIPTRQLPMGV